MPTLLSDPPQTLYLVLGGIVVVTAALAARRQDRKSVAAFGIALAVLLSLVLVDRAVESPREEAVRRVQEMVHAADTRNPDAFVAHLADTIEYKGVGSTVTLTREQVRNSPFWSVLRLQNVHVAAWDFSRDDVKEIDANTIEVGFLAKGETDGKQFPVYIRATFARQADGRFRLTRFASYEAMKRTNEAISIPNFPR
jgi:hypothetical protein